MTAIGRLHYNPKDMSGLLDIYPTSGILREKSGNS